ncbi:MAG TPA: thiol:disulfide interchange protein DsbA/DsbL [Terriglobales bacterium]|nr:thiol:disulfide interchange protein DsbA/DsbL [Terriglobales bacterium]
MREQFRIFCTIAIAVVLNLAANARSAADVPGTAVSWRAGEQYRVLPESQAKATRPDAHQVLEFFRYDCPHCARLEPYLEQLEAQGKREVSIQRVPIVWIDRNRPYARLYYALLAVGRPDLHAAVFATIHQGGNRLLDDDLKGKTSELHVKFATAHGIDEKHFRAAYWSQDVTSKVERAEMLSHLYEVDAVPMVVIGGRFVSNVPMAGSPQQLIHLISDLARRS